jgi:hypothetical protein
MQRFFLIKQGEQLWWIVWEHLVGGLASAGFYDSVLGADHFGYSRLS